MSNANDKSDVEAQSSHLSQQAGEIHENKNRFSTLKRVFSWIWKRIIVAARLPFFSYPGKFKRFTPFFAWIAKIVTAPWRFFSHLSQRDFKGLYFRGKKGWLQVRERLVRLRFVWKWMVASLLLAIPTVVFAKRFPHVSIKGIPALGLVIWFELSWAAVFIAYLISWAFGWFFDRICQEDILNIGDYDCLVRELKYPIVFVLWSITSWALIPHMCLYEHEHCTSHWLVVFEKVLLATIVVSVVWFTKALLLELLYIQAAIKSMNKKQAILVNGLYSILLLATSTKEETKEKTTKEETTMGEPMKGGPTKGETPSETPSETTKLTTNVTAKETTKQALPEKAAKELSSLSWSVAVLSLIMVLKIYWYGTLFFQWLSPVFLEPGPEAEPTEPEEALACTTRILHGEGKKNHYKTLRDKIRGNFTGDLAQPAVKDHLDRLDVLRKTGKVEAEVAQAACDIEPKNIWENLDLFEDGVAQSALDPILTVVGQGLREVKHSKKHLKKAVRDLDIIISFLFLIAATLIYVSFFVKNPGSYMTLFWTSFAGLSFALSGPAQEFVSSCVFVFSQHPYDVDDWVNIMSGKDDQLLKVRVTEIRLMSSTFRCDKKAKLVSIPHNKLSKERIENLSRWDTMDDIMEPIALEVGTVITDEMVSAESIQRMLQVAGNEWRIIVDESIDNTQYARPSKKSKPDKEKVIADSELIPLIKTEDIPKDLKKVKQLFDKPITQHVRKEAVEKAVNENIKRLVMRPRSAQVGRFYKMPTISIEPTKDPDTNYQVEIVFSCKKFISGYDDDYAQSYRDGVRQSVESFLSKVLKIKVKTKKSEQRDQVTQTEEGKEAEKGKEAKKDSQVKQGAEASQHAA